MTSPRETPSVPAEPWTLTVADVVRETADAVTIVFEPPATGERGYRPGQFLTLRIPSDLTGSVARCYSLCSCPGIDDAFKVTVKRTRDGYASNWLCDNVTTGDQIDCLPPNGAFSPAHLDDDLLLVAAGSGITPMLSIATASLAAGDGRIALFFANRDAESVIFAAQFRALVESHPDRLTVIHWLESVQGLPTESSVATLLAPFADRDAFLCGPAPFMKHTRHALERLGVPRSRVHIENFVSLSGDPFAAPRATAATAAGSRDAASSQVVVRIKGTTHTLAWARSQTLVELLSDHGVDVPYSCREGECGTCQCELLSGKIDMDTSGALDDEDIAEGVVLGCQARPVSESIEIQF